MKVLENFKDLFFDVWDKGISGVNISEIFIALLIFLFFLFLRGIFSKFVIKRLENYVSKSTNNFDNSLMPFESVYLPMNKKVLGNICFFFENDLSKIFSNKSKLQLYNS